MSLSCSRVLLCDAATIVAALAGLRNAWVEVRLVTKQSGSGLLAQRLR